MSRPLIGPFPSRVSAITSLSRVEIVADGIALVGLRVSGLNPGQAYTFSVWLRVDKEAILEHAKVLFLNLTSLRNRRIHWWERHLWQRLEVAGTAPADGIMVPRINVAGRAGSVFYIANWRFEPGLLVESDEHPHLPVPPPLVH